MDDEEYQSYRTAWLTEFPCRCGGTCRYQGPPARKPRHVRILVVLPEEPPQLTPGAARALLRILQEAADKRKREAAGKQLPASEDRRWHPHAPQARGAARSLTGRHARHAPGEG